MNSRSTKLLNARITSTSTQYITAQKLYLLCLYHEGNLAYRGENLSARVDTVICLRRGTWRDFVASYQIKYEEKSSPAHSPLAVRMDPTRKHLN